MTAINRFPGFLTAFLLLVVFGTSCLKDELYEDQQTQMQVNKDDRIIEVMGPIIGSYGQVLEFSTVDTTVGLVTVHLAANAPAPEDVKVTLAVDTSVIGEYNKRVKENFTPLPATNFQIPSFEVTIPRGGREAVLNGTIKDPSFLQSGKYALGLKVVSVSNPGYKISGNYGKQVIALRVKNQYHGTYQAVGVFHHPTAGDREINQEKELVTVEPNSVQAWLGDLGPDYQMVLTINADNTVTITPAGATPNVDQKWGPNFYDPATKSFHLHYSYNVAAPRIIEEVITRQ